MEGPHHRPRAELGPLWHMSIAQLLDYMECNNIPIPQNGSGMDRKPIKRDLIQHIRAIKGKEPSKKDTTKLVVRTGVLPPPVGSLARTPITNMAAEDLYGHITTTGLEKIEEYYQTEFVKPPYLANKGFVAKELVKTLTSEQLNENKIWMFGPGSLTVWSSNNDMLVVQDLGKNARNINIWNEAMIQRPQISDKLVTDFNLVRVNVFESFTLGARDSHIYAFTFFKGSTWLITMQDILGHINTRVIEKFPDQTVDILSKLKQGLIKCVEETLKITSQSSSSAGSSLMHYIGRELENTFEISILPLPYSKTYEPVNITELMNKVEIDNEKKK